MSISTAVQFPGRRSQAADLGELIGRVRPDVAKLAAEAVGEDAFARADERTDFAQPAIRASIAGREWIGRPPVGLWPTLSVGGPDRG
ncbi:MAG: hypothetical protein ACLPZR_17665 [Solirubrobacteraceae bacterium]